MKQRWLRLLIRLVAALIEVAVLGGAWYAQTLTTERMMVMRFFVAKNRLLEESWFSPASLSVQQWLLLVATIAFLVIAVLAARRTARLVLAEASLGLVVAGVAAWLAWRVSAADVLALYVLLAALWIVLLVQAAFTAAALRAGSAEGYRALG